MFIRLLLITLTVLCIVMGVHYFKREFGVGPGLPDLTAGWQFGPESADLDAVTPTLAPSSSASAKPETLQDQLGNLLAIPLILDEDGVASSSVTLEYVHAKKPLMVVLFGTDVSATVAASVVADLKKLPHPPLVAVDHEGGTVQRLAGAGFTRLPSWQQLCSMPDEKRTSLIASSAEELRQAGVDVVLGPVVDRVASGSALRSRSCSSDPEKIASIARNLIETYQAAQLTPVLKHYPGIGTARADLHTQPAKVTITPEDTQPFEMLLALHPRLPVMISHVRIDPADPNNPCSMSYVCVGELRRVFPEAFLISDALEMKSAGFLASSSAVQRPLSARASQTLRAGADVALFGPTVTQADLDLVLQNMENDLALLGRPDDSTSAHITRAKQWRSSVSSR
jgi:beta-N-acetylhexosaminidase